MNNDSLAIKFKKDQIAEDIKESYLPMFSNLTNIITSFQKDIDDINKDPKNLCKELNMTNFTLGFQFLDKKISLNTLEG